MSGLDSSLFSFENDSLSFKQAPDHENLLDNESNNNYHITLTATDSHSNTNALDISIQVVDKTYLAMESFVANDARQDDAFAYAVATDGLYTIIGVPREDTLHSNSGAAYLYKKLYNGTHTLISKLKAPIPSANANFGNSVAIDGNYILVGAENEDFNGEAYLFKKDSDTFVTLFMDNNRTQNDKFANAVSMSGDYIVIGADHTNIGTFIHAGNATLFKKDANGTIRPIGILSSPAYQDNNFFGKSVSIDGNFIVVGSTKNARGDSKGQAYLYKIDQNSSKNPIRRIKSIEAQDGVNDDNFSSCVSISGDYIAIGAPNNDEKGSVYIFEKNGNDVTQMTKIQVHDVTSNALFGSSVSLKGDYLLIGASGDSTIAPNAGSAYMFKREGDIFRQIDKIYADDAGIYKNFARFVSLSDDSLAIGMDYNNTDSSTQTSKGKAYMFIKDANQVP